MIDVKNMRRMEGERLKEDLLQRMNCAYAEQHRRTRALHSEEYREKLSTGWLKLYREPV